MWVLRRRADRGEVMKSDKRMRRAPIHAINRFSFLEPTVFLGELQPADFAQLGARLVDRMKETHLEREQLEYRKYDLDFDDAQTWR